MVWASLRGRDAWAIIRQSRGVWRWLVAVLRVCGGGGLRKGLCGYDFEPHGIASGASGNPRGLYNPRFSARRSGEAILCFCLRAGGGCFFAPHGAA